MTTRRKSANVYDYPEHLNPFHEEDNHSRLRFWTVTKKKTRSNSFSFQSIKDFRGSIRLPRSRNRTDTSSSLSQLKCLGTKPKNATHSESETSQSQSRFFSTLRKLSRSLSIRNKNKNSTTSLEQTSQIENDEVQLRVSPSVRQPTESYSVSQRLSVTPLPRSRFHERVRNSENPEPAKLESPASTPTDDNNPFNDDTDDETKETLRPHSPSKPATPARKKKRAPPPPPVRQSSLKAKSLTDYKASKQVEGTSTQETVTQKEIETINIDNNVNIQIRVEEVTFTDSSEQKETTVTVQETSVNEETNSKQDTVHNEEITSQQNETTINNGETTHNEQENIESTQNDTTVKEEISKTEDIPEATKTVEEISAVSETAKETSAGTSEKNPAASETEEILPVSEPTEQIPPVSEPTEEIPREKSSSTETISDTEDSINFNSEITISSSHSSISSDTKLEQIEQELQQNAIQDTSDLLDLVNKLKMEVDKLTDDTNNNIVETEEERKARNIESWIKLDSPNRVKTELNVSLNGDDDDDVICSVPMSPKVRLRKDNDWIRQPN